jgi:hypothetical protein
MVSDLLVMVISIVVLMVSIPVIVTLILAVKILNDGNRKVNEFLKELLKVQNNNEEDK